MQSGPSVSRRDMPYPALPLTMYVSMCNVPHGASERAPASGAPESSFQASALQCRVRVRGSWSAVRKLLIGTAGQPWVAGKSAHRLRYYLVGTVQGGLEWNNRAALPGEPSNPETNASGTSAARRRCPGGRRSGRPPRPRGALLCAQGRRWAPWASSSEAPVRAGSPESGGQNSVPEGVDVARSAASVTPEGVGQGDTG